MTVRDFFNYDVLRETFPTIKPSQKIVNISSPFGLNSKELFLNIRYKGIIANKVSNSLYLTDLDGHLVNVEGSPVFDKMNGKVIGIRLPSLHSFNLFMGCSLMVPIENVLESLSSTNNRTIRRLDSDASFVDLVVKIKDGHLR